MNKINVAVIGAGRIGLIHTKNVYENNNANLKWVFDPFEKALNGLKNISKNITMNINDIFNDNSVDAVIICSPTNTHIEMIEKCIKKNKFVLCEKPVDLSLQSAKKCFENVKNDSDKIMIGFNRRFDPSFSEIKERLSELGKIEQVIIVSRDPVPPPAEYVKNSGGIFKDMTIHDFDMARFILGDIVEVNAYGQNVVDQKIKNEGDFDAAHIIMKNENDALVTIVNNRRCVYGYDQRIEVFGEKGSLNVGNQIKTSVYKNGDNYTDSSNRYLDFFIDRYKDSYKIELQTFLNSIKENIAMNPSLLDGIKALELAEIATKASGSKINDNCNLINKGIK
jgi:myo-inositol 2-dehydrogenase/D-chiro-inositol 1-dehydrogenase